MTLAEEIVEIGKKLHTRGFVAANDGNISAKDEEGRIWITPTGVSKGSMRPEDILCLDADGKILLGEGKKSSETGMHLRVYQEDPAVRAVVHAHPAYATSFAIAGKPLDVPCYPEAMTLLGTVPVAPYATPGSPGVAESVAPLIRDHHALLLAHHGALTWGSDLTEAYYRMESVENYARILLYTQYILHTDHVLTEEQQRVLPRT